MKGLVLMVGLVLVWLTDTAAQRRSDEMIRTLNAPPPDWLSLAEPIKVEPIEGGMQDLDQSRFRSPSGGVMHGTHHIEIPKLNLVVELDEDRRINSPGDASISPDETKLVVNCGTDVYLYEIREDGQLTNFPVQVPHVTYDEGPKWFISNWVWASNDVLLGFSDIEDEKGYEILETRFYAFHIGTSSLARLDLSRLRNGPHAPMFELVSVGKDLSELVISMEGEDYTTKTVRVKADLKSPHKLIQAQKTIKEPVPGTSSLLSLSLAGNQNRSPGSRPSSGNPFPWLWLLLILGVTLGVATYLYRSSHHR